MARKYFTLVFLVFAFCGLLLAQDQPGLCFPNCGPGGISFNSDGTYTAPVATSLDNIGLTSSGLPDTLGAPTGGSVAGSWDPGFASELSGPTTGGVGGWIRNFLNQPGVIRELPGVQEYGDINAPDPIEMGVDRLCDKGAMSQLACLYLGAFGMAVGAGAGEPPEWETPTFTYSAENLTGQRLQTTIDNVLERKTGLSTWDNLPAARPDLKQLQNVSYEYRREWMSAVNKVNLAAPGTQAYEDAARELRAVTWKEQSFLQRLWNMPDFIQ